MLLQYHCVIDPQNLRLLLHQEDEMMKEKVWKEEEQRK